MKEPIYNENNAANLSARLLNERKVLAFGELNEKKAAVVIASLLALADESDAPIKLYINSTGGCETEILGIFDVMNAIPCPVETVCVGKAHGLSALLLAGGDKGKRSAYANSEIMLTQVSRDRTFGQASDIELETEHLLNAKNRITGILAKLCGRTQEELFADMERKHWLYAEDALSYGLIDRIID